MSSDGWAESEASGARETLRAYGEWVASLATWTHMATLTYGPPARADNSRLGWTRVGMRHSQRQLRDWFHRYVRTTVPGAVCWFETEPHESGQPHHHGLIALGSAGLPVRPMRQGWERTNGHARLEVIDSAFAVARYVEKRAVLLGAQPPVVWGLRRKETLTTGADTSDDITVLVSTAAAGGVDESHARVRVMESGGVNTEGAADMFIETSANGSTYAECAQ